MSINSGSKTNWGKDIPSDDTQILYSLSALLFFLLNPLKSNCRFNYYILPYLEREPPVVELYPKEPQKLRVGESTRFSCRVVSGAPYPTLTWSRKDGRPLSSRTIEDYPGVITIQEAGLDDEGQYECRAENSAGFTTVTATLEINESPVITLYPNRTQLTVVENDEISIQCTATGKPTPTVTFKYPERARVDDRIGSRLDDPRPYSQQSQAFVSIYKAKRTDAGVYECIATNEAGQDIRYIQVAVDEKRGDIGPSGDDDDNEIYPPYITTTQTPSRPIYPPSRPVYPPVVSPDSSLRDPFEAAPFRASINDRVVLKCQPEGTNDLRTEWRRTDGRSLPSHSYSSYGDLVIENVQYDAAGQYECFTYDTKTNQPIVVVIANVIVEGSPPKISFSPTMPIEAKPGESIIIYCNATGEPPLTVNWHLDKGQAWPR